MSIFNHAGCKDTDYKILSYLDDKDLRSIFLLNRQANELLSCDSFWIAKTIYLFQNAVPIGQIHAFKNKHCPTSTFKTFYASLKIPLRSAYPHYEAAIALDNQRHDIIHLLQLYRQTETIQMYSSNNEKYYYRQTSGEREGPFSKEEYDYQRKQKIYKSGFYQNNKLLTETIKTPRTVTVTKYRNNKMISSVTTNHKGIKKREVTYEENNTQFVRKYKGGKRTEEGRYVSGKKEGRWTVWKDNGEVYVYEYENDKPISRQPLAQNYPTLYPDVSKALKAKPGAGMIRKKGSQQNN
jgi:hypothetical protein